MRFAHRALPIHVALLVACGDPAMPERATRLGEAVEIVRADPAGEPCHDVSAALRACFGASGPHLVPRDLPPAPADAVWRCEQSRCVLEPARPFECDEGVCRQRFPRVVDDADWECADVDGLVVCRDRAPIQSVPGPREPGWICREASPRICIDLLPDRPGAGNYDCRFEHEPTLARICRARSEPALGGPCRDRCPIGMRCLQGICAPEAVETPDCWTDSDCEGGARCVLARCSS